MGAQRSRSGLVTGTVAGSVGLVRRAGEHVKTRPPWHLATAEALAPNACPSDHQRRFVHERKQGRIDGRALRLQEHEQRTLIGCYLAIPTDPLGKPGSVCRLSGIVRDNLNLLARQMGNGALFRGLLTVAGE